MGAYRFYRHLPTMSKRLVFSILFLFSFSLWAQPENPWDPDATEEYIFRPNELSIIRLTLSPEDKSFLLDPDNVESEIYLEAIFQMINSKMDTILETSVGIRLRGNTSRYQNKKPFKIDFREFGGGKFFGLKKFNLKPNTNDPSQVREPLTLKYYRGMKVPAARTHPLRLYMNDEYMGVYSNVEQIDDEFLDLWYGHEDGFLYKCSYGANLEDDGQIFNTTIYESELNEDDDTRTELAHFVDVLNNTSDLNFQAEIENVFEVEGYLSQLAVEALLGHWDGYSYNQNNYYLFFNDQTQKFEFFPYDADNTWGIDWVGRDWGNRNLHDWAISDPRPLTKRILAVPEYREKYVNHIALLLEHFFKEDYLNPILETYQTILDLAVSEDTYFDDSFGFTYNHFINSFSEGMNNHVEYGIKEYLEVRTQSALEQLPDLITDIDRDQTDALEFIYPNPSDSPNVYLYTVTGPVTNLVVYSSTGVEIPIKFTHSETKKTELIFPDHTPFGLYLIRVNGQVHRWIYR